MLHNPEAYDLERGSTEHDHLLREVSAEVVMLGSLNHDVFSFGVMACELVLRLVYCNGTGAVASRGDRPLESFTSRALYVAETGLSMQPAHDYFSSIALVT